MIPKVGLKEMSKLNFLNRASALLRGLWKGWGDRWQRKNICKPHTTRDIRSMYTDAQDPIEKKKKIQLESEQGTRRDISPEDSKWAHERIFHAISHKGNANYSHDEIPLHTYWKSWNEKQWQLWELVGMQEPQISHAQQVGIWNGPDIVGKQFPSFVKI